MCTKNVSWNLSVLVNVRNMIIVPILHSVFNEVVINLICNTNPTVGDTEGFSIVCEVTQWLLTILYNIFFYLGWSLTRR